MSHLSYTTVPLNKGRARPETGLKETKKPGSSKPGFEPTVNKCTIIVYFLPSNLCKISIEGRSHAYFYTFQTYDWSKMTSFKLRDVNRAKNRYLNVNAYDHSRVILTPDDEVQENEEGSDYINANYVSGYDEMSTAYIATQGPLPETFADFWRMVWQCDVQTIVMLTHLEERSRTKCDQYWPNKGATTYGNYRQVFHLTFTKCFQRQR